jgi:hypothetical protein
MNEEEAPELASGASLDYLIIMHEWNNERRDRIE